MNRSALLVVGLTAFALLVAFSPKASQPEPEVPAEASKAQTPEFLAVDVYIDPGATPLAAYQLTLTAAGATIVGIEGGEHPAFAQAPYYDAGAMQHERVIIAALSTQANLPAGRTRVARIHVMTSGAAAPTFALQLQSAGAADASRISAAVSHELNGPTPTGAGK